jgi:hypothetical protein
MRRKVGKFTEADAAALRLIKACGFVGVDRGRPYLESNQQISPWRFHRLIEHGCLTPSQDSLLGGGIADLSAC